MAQALLGSPELLILDEPTVGLDPKQIIEIRNLIKELGKNHTVILSSHILPEVQAICERVIVINDGKIIADDTPDHLARAMSNESGLAVRLEGPATDDNNALRALPGVHSCNPLGEREKGVFEYLVEPENGADIRRDVFRIAAEKNWPILSMKSTEMSLEEIFLKLTSGEYVAPPKQELASKQDKKAQKNRKGAATPAAEMAEKSADDTAKTNEEGSEE